MSESILNALIHLFAIVANVNKEGLSAKGKSIVKTYLKRYLSGELLEEYLNLFDNYYNFYKRELGESEDDESIDNHALINFQIANVSRQIKTGLLREERIIVYTQLLEFVFEDHVLTRGEDFFIQTVADSFNLSEKEYTNLRELIFSGDTEKMDAANVMVINNQLTEWSDSLAWVMREKNRQKRIPYKHIFRENLYGRLIFLYIESTRMLIFRYIGELNLYQENQKIEKGRTYIFKSGSIIKGPNIESIYYNEVSTHFLHTGRKPIHFVGKELEFRFPNSKNGIHTFTFSEYSGRLIGIMGGSGVGKSTLLNLLNGKLLPLKGKVTVNGIDVHRGKGSLKGVIGFVPQDDLLFEELSVFENLYYNARLCFSDYTEDQINHVVEDVLIDLDLHEIRNLKVGDPLNKFISGGQRKRLNIALELMREPSVLFVDEPTSGLSSADSEKVMDLLKNQAMSGRLVIVNIHQPASDIFKMFDKLWVLDKGGYPIYQGHPMDAIIYFKTASLQVNAAESQCPQCGNVEADQIFKIVEAREIDDFGNLTRKRRMQPEDWYEKYLDNIQQNIQIEEEESSLPAYDFKIPNLVEQFKVFSMRNLLAKLSNKQYLILNFFEAPLLAFILGFFSKYMTESGYVFAENKNLPVFLFMSVVVAIFLGLTVSAEEIIKDRKILERESFLKLSRLSYINSKVVFLFALSAFQTLMFVLVGNLILEIKGMLLPYWAILFTAACMGNMMGLNISSGLDSVIAIYVLIPMILVPQLLLGGAMIKYDDMHDSITSKIHVPIFADFMTTRWAYEALAVYQFKHNRFEKHFFDYEQKISESEYLASYLIPRIQTKLKSVVKNWDPENAEMIARDLVIIRNGLLLLASKADRPVFEYVSDLELGNFSVESAEEINGYLFYMKDLFLERGEEASRLRDEKYNRMVDSLGKDEFIQLRKDYYNKKLADILLNRTDLEKVYEADFRFVQKKDPVLMEPDSDIGRAHFYAPMKEVRGIRFSTFVFNILMMWVGSGVLYITLLFDVLRKIIKYFEHMKFRD